MFRACGSAFEKFPIDLGGQDEVALRQSLDLVSIRDGVPAAPSQAQIGMAPFGFGHGADAV